MIVVMIVTRQMKKVCFFEIPKIDSQQYPKLFHKHYDHNCTIIIIIIYILVWIIISTEHSIQTYVRVI